MLLNDFFTYSDLQIAGSLLKAKIRLNAEHPIFKGHFPERPIMPGVCMMQMVKELLEVHLNRRLKLVKAADLKFLSFIDPTQNKTIQFEAKIALADKLIQIDARLLDEGTILFKFKGIFEGR